MFTKNNASTVLIEKKIAERLTCMTKKWEYQREKREKLLLSLEYLSDKYSKKTIEKYSYQSFLIKFF